MKNMIHKGAILKNTDQQIEKILYYYQEANQLGDFKVADRWHDLLKYLYNIKQAISKRKIQIIRPKQPDFEYNISLELIFRIFNYLIDESGDEKYCYCTGVIDQVNKIITPTTMLTPKMAFQNPVFVKGDLMSIKDVLSYLEQFGHTVVLQCHRHPGNGVGSTHESGTDIKNHKGWEKFYPMIGMIAVKTGHFRFFSAGKDFEVSIYGSEVERIDSRTYCLPQ